MKASEQQLNDFLHWCYNRYDAYLVQGSHYDIKSPDENELIKQYIGESVTFKGINGGEVKAYRKEQ